MKPRVLLIKTAPRSDRPCAAPPLGIMMLASALREQADVAIYDAGLEMYGNAPPPVEAVKAMVAAQKPLLVGLSVLTCERECMAALAAAVKAASPDTVVVLGGPYPTCEPESWRSCPHLDWALLGEADETFPELLRLLIAGEPPRAAPWLVGRETDGPHEKAPPVADLDALPLPAYDLVDLRRYSSSRYRNQTGLPAYAVYATVMTSRGCPFRCAYCHDVLGKRFRGMSPERVMREIDALAAAGVREIHLIDDIFNLDLKRAKAIFAAIAARHPKLRLAFPNGIRADSIDQEFAVAAKRAGTWYAAVAVETASPRLQKAIGKHIKLERVAQAVEWLEGAGIRTRSFVMLGFPTETVEEMEASIRFVIDSRTSEASFFNVVPYVGSRLHAMAEQWMPGNVDAEVQIPFYSERSFYEQATGVNLSRIRDRAILRFYLSRGRFLKVLWRTPLRFWFSAAFLGTVGYFGLRAAKGVMPWRRRGRRAEAVAREAS